MNNSYAIKTLLLATINEIAADPSRYAVNPGRNFTRNRKLGFHNILLMLLTMEADCIKEELYRYFGRTTDAPSKAAFYKQRKKLTVDALANLLYIFNSRLPKKLYNGKYQFIACDGSAVDISLSSPAESGTSTPHSVGWLTLPETVASLQFTLQTRAMLHTITLPM